ncbi:hypothetical protein FIBSPDRAFT_1050095 [Athelia psychrophila]|uniref:Uncharacterized protein n=1 Tax=Athelia psychrophila TaxID=1759441 RepID=A0A166B891_9AGAM|nr:hypothetical protein FIBSPDRAFT_1050095 [Fibularhizoctonia sp. CBS 109695]
MTAALLDTPDLQDLLADEPRMDKAERKAQDELSKKLGVPLILDNLHSLGPGTLTTLQPLHALMFLFKYISPSSSSASLGSTGTPDPDFAGFFAEPASRGYAATSADWLRAAHNTLRPPEAINLDKLGLDPEGNAHGGWDGRAEGWVGMARDVVVAQIGTCPEGAVKLEFSLLGLRDEPLVALQARYSQAQQSGDHAIASELLATLYTENTKCE